MTDNAVIDVESQPAEAPEPSEEAGTVEVLDRLPDRRPQDLAVERAAEMAMDSVVPRKDEILTLAMEARMLAYGNLVPGALRGKPADVFLILLVGRDLGIAQTSALQQVYVVDGKPSLAPKLLNARLRHLKLGGIYRHPDNSNTWAAALIVPWGSVQRLDRGELKEDGTPLRPIDVAIDQVEFTMEDAEQAGLEKKDNWKKYPQRMLWWRAAGYAADDFFPEASLGLYSPDELGAVTDEDGKPIDVNSVEIPDGFSRGERGGGAGDSDDSSPASAEELWVLQERIQALPGEHQAELKKRWAGARGLKIGEGPNIWPAWHVPASRLALVHSLLNGVEAQAKSGGWDAEKERLRVQTRVATVASDLLRGLLLFSTLAPTAAPWPPALEEDASAFGRCDVCGAAITADEDERLRADTDFVEHGDGPHLIRRVLDGEPDDDQPQAEEKAAEAEPWVQEIIQEVRKLEITEVDARLRTWSLPKTGNQQTRRQRLAAAMVRDRQRPTA